MKHFVVIYILVALLLAGCNGKKAQNKESESTAESAEKSNLVEMSVSAQQHIGMQVAPAALTQLNEYLRATGTVQPVDSRIGVVGPLARGRIMEVRAKVGDRRKIIRDRGRDCRNGRLNKIRHRLGPCTNDALPRGYLACVKGHHDKIDE